MSSEQCGLAPKEKQGMEPIPWFCSMIAHTKSRHFWFKDSRTAELHDYLILQSFWQTIYLEMPGVTWWRRKEPNFTRNVANPLSSTQLPWPGSDSQWDQDNFLDNCFPFLYFNTTVSAYHQNYLTTIYLADPPSPTNLSPHLSPCFTIFLATRCKG